MEKVDTAPDGHTASYPLRIRDLTGEMSMFLVLFARKFLSLPMLLCRSIKGSTARSINPSQRTSFARKALCHTACDGFTYFFRLAHAAVPS